MASMFAVALLAALAAYTIPTALAVEADELTFTAIKMYQVNGRNATGQWGLTMERGNKQTGSMIKLNCSTDVYGACISDVLTPVMQDAGDLVRVNYTLNPNYTSLVTYKSQTPTSLQVRLCYSAYSYFDRAWRKKNKPYPRLSQNCPRKSGKIPLNLTVPAGSTFAAANSGSYTFDFDLLDEIPTATWFAMVWVYCGDTVCAFESTELKNFVETKAEMGITSGMRAAAIILSIFGPTFFIAFYVADTLYYKKNGRGLGWA